MVVGKHALCCLNVSRLGVGIYGKRRKPQFYNFFWREVLVLLRKRLNHHAIPLHVGLLGLLYNLIHIKTRFMPNFHHMVCLSSPLLSGGILLINYPSVRRCVFVMLRGYLFHYPVLVSIRCLGQIHRVNIHVPAYVIPYLINC